MRRLLIGFAGFVVGFGGLVLAQSAPPQTTSQASPILVDEFSKGTYKAPMPGLVSPNPIKRTYPKYTPAAMKQKIQGSVTLEVVVDVAGKVDRVRVTQSLHPELDAEAVAAAKAWSFESGKLNGTAVPVRAALVFEFNLH
jgi:TonB family protein